MHTPPASSSPPAAATRSAAEATVSAAPPRVRVAALHKRFTLKGKDIVAVGDVSFDVRDREFVSLIGPSGCGKSTVLNIVAGLIRATTGFVTVDGEPVAGPMRKVGYIFQKDTTFPWKTVEDNIGLGLEYRGVPAAERRERVAAMVKMAKLEGFEKAYPAMLSGGMRQRVALMRCFITEPEVLLMDEPFGALDTHTALLLHGELLALWERTRQAILFVTHNLSEAITLSDRIVLLGARPSQVRRVVDVNLPRPRDVIAVRETEEYQRIYGELWHALGREFQQGMADVAAGGPPR
jgi:NitT/TauT family transport system ATP-binding protein